MTLQRILGALAFLFAVGLGLYFVAERQEPLYEPIESAKTYVDDEVITLTIASTTIETALAVSLERRILGLSGTPMLPENEGLLFVYPEPGLHGIWMKDMLYPIDIIWLDAAGTIIYIEKNVSPDTFPESFRPHSNAVFVLEVNANFSEKNGVKIGDKLEGLLLH